jgi:hypothetical protein
MRTCIFGDGCIIRLNDERHENNYVHGRSNLPICPKNPACESYALAKDYILNGGVMNNKIYKAQTHVALCYHSPINEAKTKQVREPIKKVPSLDLNSMNTRTRSTSSASNKSGSREHSRDSNRDESPARDSRRNDKTPSPKNGSIHINSGRKKDEIVISISELKRKIEMQADSIEYLKTELLKIGTSFDKIRTYLVLTDRIPPRDLI